MSNSRMFDEAKSKENKQKIIDRLIEKGRDAGKLSIKDIDAAIVELDMEMEIDELDRLYDTLENNNIEIELAVRISEGEKDSHLVVLTPDGEVLELTDVDFQMPPLRERLGLALKTLTPREKPILFLRFGLEDGHPRTLEEVGKEFNITRERIRQIEAKALRELLRSARRLKARRDFLNQSGTTEYR